MSKATDKLLGELHGRVAKTMLEALEASDQAQGLLDEYETDLPNDVVNYLKKSAMNNPALLTAVTKFLKDNSITCVIEDNNDMSELEERLKNKRHKKRIGNVVPIDES